MAFGRFPFGVAPFGAALAGVAAPATGLPVVSVQIAFDSGYTTAAGSRTWTDVTSYVDADRGVSVQRGRGDQWSSVQPSRLSVTLDNRDGRFTPEYTSGAYYPNVKKGRPIRVRATWATVTYDVFLGYVDEWPVDWPGGSDAYSTVTVSATSRMARLGRSTEFKSIVEEEILYDVPTLYYPLGEASGSTTAGNIAPGRSERLTTTQAGSGGTLTFGDGIGPGTDSLTAPIFTPVDSANGLFLDVTTSSALGSGATLAVDIACSFVTTLSASQRVVAQLYSSTGSSGGEITLAVTNTGTLRAIGTGTAGTVFVDSVASVNDGLLHHGVLRLSQAAGTMSLKLLTDGVSSSTSGTAVAFADLNRFSVGGRQTLDPALFPATVAHAALWVNANPASAITDARFIVQYNAAANGFNTEASGARVARYGRLAGVATAEITTETGLSTAISHKDITGESAVAAMQAVADTEDGVVFDAGDGTLTFHARSHRYASTSSFTLDTSAGDVETGLLPRLDDQHLTNDVTASRLNGVTIRSTNAASITEYGYYRETVDILTTSDNEVQSRADWEVNRFGTPRVTVPNVRVALHAASSALVTSLLAADIGTRFTLSNLPAQAPAATMEFFVEGITHDIGTESWFIEFNTSAAAYANVWTLDSSTFSVLDSTTVLAY